MEHFTRSVSDSGLDNGELDSKDYNDIDIDALLNRPRLYGYKRTVALEEAPEFVRRLDPFIEVEAGSSLAFECMWKGFPCPVIRWYRDDEEVTCDHPYYDIEVDNQTGIAKLVLSEVISQDEGAFKCKAENQEGVASTTGYLSVTGDKTLTLAQQRKTPSPTGTSPCVSSAPHLRTILEQQSLEEREGEAQKKLPPSPLQDYIEIVQKTKTWPMSKMGYNPQDFLHKQSLDDDDSGSDTSVDSQPDDCLPSPPPKVTVQLPLQSNKMVIPNGLYKFKNQDADLLMVDHGDSDSVHSFDSTEDEDQPPPVCTVSVQMRSSETASRLTRIRQEDAHRLSLNLSQENSTDREEELNGDQKTRHRSSSPPPLHSENGLATEDAHKNCQNGAITNTYECSSNHLPHETYNQVTENSTQLPTKGFDNCLTNITLNNHNTCLSNGNDKNLHTGTELDLDCNHVNERNPDKPIELKQNQDSPIEQEKSHITKIKKIASNSNKKSIIQQMSKDRKGKIKKQKSIVELSLEWVFQKITGKVGEQLDLPWIYYFAFTVLCACFAAAIKLNPLYMIIIVALLSFFSFRFILHAEGDNSEVLVDNEKISENQNHKN